MKPNVYSQYVRFENGFSHEDVSWEFQGIVITNIHPRKIEIAILFSIRKWTDGCLYLQFLSPLFSTEIFSCRARCFIARHLFPVRHDKLSRYYTSYRISMYGWTNWWKKEGLLLHSLFSKMQKLLKICSLFISLNIWCT